MECLHYALNLPTLVVITGCPNVKILDQAFEAARTLHPLTEAEVIAILDKTDQAAVHGKYEPYKVTRRFDGTIHHPEWMTTG